MDNLLTPVEQDNCTPTKEQIEKYLLEPNDVVAQKLSQWEKKHIARVILYGENITKAQHKKTSEKWIEAVENQHGSIGYYISFTVPEWQSLKKEMQESVE